MSVRIAHLADHRSVIPTLARWFHAEWAYLNPGRSLAEVERLIAERARQGAIPLALVAFADDELIGTVCLKTHDMDTHLDLSPWLAGLYVIPARRGQGVGALLVEAIEREARALGVAELHLYTPQSETFYLALGWKTQAHLDYHGHPVALMRKLMMP